MRAKEVSAMHGDPYQQTAERIWASDRALLADLYNGTLTYGEYAKKRQENAATFDDAIERKRSLETHLLQPPGAKWGESLPAPTTSRAYEPAHEQPLRPSHTQSCGANGNGYLEPLAATTDQLMVLSALAVFAHALGCRPLHALCVYKTKLLIYKGGVITY